MDDMLLSRILNIPAIKRMKARVDPSIKYGAIVGATTIISGILGGRAGLLIGGLASSGLAALAANEEYKSVPYIILHEITPEERRKLLRKVRSYIVFIHGISIRDFVYSVNSSQDLEDGIIAILKSSLLRMNLRVHSS